MSSLYELNMQGHAARSEGRWQDALDSFSAMLAAAQAAQDEWGLRIAYTCRGLCRRQQGKLLLAVDDFAAAIAASELNAAAYYYRANALLALGRGDEAETDHRRWIASLSALLEPLEAVFAYPADLALAQHDCNTVLEQGTVRPVTFFARGAARELLRDFYRAIEDYQQAAADATLQAAAEDAIQRAVQGAKKITPNDRHLMRPGVQYCVLVYDGDGNTSQITFFDLATQHTEDRRGEALADLKGDGWQYVSGINHKEGYTYYFQRPALNIP